MNHSITETNFKLPNQTSFYKGKVRDVYNIADKYLVMVTTDRISAFDVVLPLGIPFKGQVLNQIAAKFLDATSDIVPNWKLSSPDPMVTVGILCEPFKVEMVVRGYLAGHAWREYKQGKRTLCGEILPDGLKENDKLPNPIITPTTKEAIGHDEDISKKDILDSGLVSFEDYQQLEKFTLSLFKRGTEMAAQRNLILVDTKYEFGKHNGKIFLIDEIHTPDSSRYFYKEGYEQRQTQNQAQRQLSKEFVREWLMENGFQGKEGQSVPEMTNSFIDSVSKRYIELYEQITGDSFIKSDLKDVNARVLNNINKVMPNLNL